MPHVSMTGGRVIKSGIGVHVPDPFIVSNPVGINFAAAGGPSLGQTDFPIFQDQVRSSRGFTQAASATTFAARDSNGWPTEDVCIVGHELSGAPQQTWQTNGTGKFAGGFTGVGTVAPHSIGGCSISNIVVTGSGATQYTTFDLTTSSATWAYQITGTTGGVGVQNIYCYLPAYRSSQSNAGNINGYSPTSLFTTEAINHYKQYGWIRDMFYKNAWNNTAANTSSNRNTATNCRAQQNFFTLHTDGYPLDWFVDFLIALNNAGGKTGIWHCTPPNADSTYIADDIVSLQRLPAGIPIFIECSNELWNGTGLAGGALQALGVTAGYANDVHGRHKYLGVVLHNLAAQFSAAFGSRFGTDVKIVAASQQGGQGITLLGGDMIPNMVSLGYTPNADIHLLSAAPYINLTAPGNADSIATLLANLTNGGVKSANQLINGFNTTERLAVLAKDWGMQGIIAYEGGWQVNAEPSTVSNIGATVLDPGISTVLRTLYADGFNSGFTGVTHNESGVNSQPGNLGCVDTLCNDWTTLTTTGSATLSALQTYMPGTYVPTKNVINGPGSSFSSLNYADYTGAVRPVLTLSGLAPPAYNVTGLIPYVVNCLQAATYTLVVNFTGVPAGTIDIRVDGVNVITGASIPANTSDTPVTLGSFALGVGVHSLIIGRASLNITLSSLISWN